MTTAAKELIHFELPARARTSTRTAVRLPRVFVAFLRAPLVLKLIGANVIIALGTISVAMATHGNTLADRRMVVLLVGALIVAQIANSALVMVALRPIGMLEDTASRVLSGDTSARVGFSLLADRNLARTGHALNQLLDELMKERDRIRRLASKVVRAQDEERARIARELHDATTQTMAGVVLQLTAAAQASGDPETAAKLDDIRNTASEALDEVRTLSHTIYPRVLEDLGLRAALHWLARRTRQATGLEIGVTLRGVGDTPSNVASALYRVAQEALLNTVRHASATTVELRLDMGPVFATLEVEDDGVGFNVAEAEARRPGMGIFSMRERIALVDIDSEPGRGCCVRARVPLEEPTL
jgi:signal transduction histidine kinase